MAGKIVWYKHHNPNKKVAVQEDLKGRHREHCLCFRPCAKFHPEGDPEPNCRYAQTLFALAREWDLVIPVWECPHFEEVVGDSEDI